MTPDPFVKAVQKKLIAKGYSVGAAGADGIAGDDTYDAIEKFQTDRRMTVTRQADKATWDALDDAGERVIDRDTPASADDSAVADVPIVGKAWPRQAECERFYGKVGEHQGSLVLPFPMKIAWDLSKTVTKITLHEKVIESAGRAFEAIASAYSPAQRAELGIDLFGGSLNVRKMRGGSAWSMHSWGIAIDFDPIRNQLKWDRTRARLAKPDAEKFWSAWEAEGWLSLGRARDMDWMHTQAARL